jgi:hypothetical protein
MASDRQIAANRRNAAKSTGPKRKSGKAVVSRNAVRHGLTAQQALVPGENEDEFEALVQKLIAEFQPEGEFELQLVERITTSIWRQRRIYRIESEILRAEYFEAELLRLRDLSDLYASDSGELTAVETAIEAGSDVDVLDEAIVQGRKVIMAKAQSDNSLGKAFARGNARGDTLSKLSRYEAGIERALYKAHHELLRLQAQRRGEGGMVPHAVDVHVDGSD